MSIPADGLVIVTGTTGALGTAIANRALESGLRVVGVARRGPGDDLAGTRDGRYAHIRWDLSDIESLKGLVDLIVREHGSPYALINNAAIGTDGLLPTMHNRDIESLIRTNLTAPIVLSKYAVRPMLARRSGRIINISSIVARTGFKGLAGYGATKSGLEGFTRAFAREVGGRAVTVNAVAPGFLETDMTSALPPHELDRIRTRSPLRRFATAKEVASAVQFLLSSDAAAITGTVQTIDAGATA